MDDRGRTDLAAAASSAQPPVEVGIAAPASHVDGESDAALLELYERLAEGVGLTEVLQQAAAMVRDFVHAERATIYLLHEQTAELESQAVIGNVARRIRVPLDRQSLAGYCGSTGRAFVIDDAYGNLSPVDACLRFDRSWDRLNNFRTRDVMCAPAVFRGSVLGVVQAINRTAGRFGPDDLKRLQSVVRLVAYELFHARLYDELASLKRLDREKAQFMRVLVHELKSPVAGARTLIDGMSLAARNQPQLDAPLNRIGSRMDQLLGMIGDLLELSKVKADEPLGEVSIFDLVPQTIEACQPYVEQAQAGGLSFEMDLPAEPLPARFDQQGYQLVVSNLVSNAIKYTPAGSVGVRLGRDESDGVVLEVRDSGMGIPQAELPKLFGEFFRASNARQSKVHGTGVGLAAIKQMIDRFNGTIEVHSRENVGTRFVVRLPGADGVAGGGDGEADYDAG